MNYLCLDYGLSRIGVAISTSGGVAKPHMQINSVSWSKVIPIIVTAITETRADVLVIGYPLNTDGSPSKMCENIDNFVARLKEHVSLPIELFDERYSTVAAQNILSSRGKKNTTHLVDKVAASVILNKYLEKLEGDN